MEVNLTVEGFKKGKIFLQKVNENQLINVDSAFVNNDKMIKLSYDINSPELFYISIDVSKNDNLLEFFGEKGEISINSKLKNFSSDFQVYNSFNDSVYRIYIDIIKKFNFEELDLIKTSIEMSKRKSNDSLKIIQEEIKKLNKRKTLYSLNFAVNNGNSSVAPLIGINEFSESKVLIDTIIKSLSKKVIDSKYGNDLKSIFNSN
tara:strand:- start:1820 stop:2431 length:612 start_codon:yes stop_codon:yes gene_type:complete